MNADVDDAKRRRRRRTGAERRSRRSMLAGARVRLACCVVCVDYVLCGWLAMCGKHATILMFSRPITVFAHLACVCVLVSATTMSAMLMDVYGVAAAPACSVHACTLSYYVRMWLSILFHRCCVCAFFSTCVRVQRNSGRIDSVRLGSVDCNMFLAINASVYAKVIHIWP